MATKRTPKGLKPIPTRTRVRMQGVVWKYGTILGRDEIDDELAAEITADGHPLPDSYRIHFEGEMTTSIIPRKCFEVVETPAQKGERYQRELDKAPTEGVAVHVANIDGSYSDDVVRVAKTLYYKAAEHANLTGVHVDYAPWEAAHAGARMQYLGVAQVMVDAYLEKPIAWIIPPPTAKKRKARSKVAA